MNKYIQILDILKQYNLISNTNINCFIKCRPEWFLRNYSDKLSKEQLEYCVKQASWTALEYAADKLSKEQFDYCVKQYSSTALKYAADKLSKEQLDYCKENC